MATVCCVPAVTDGQATDRPNVLLIAVDDMNDWVGCLEGYSGRVHTPHIDALADRGMLFLNAHCPAPVCNPSRTAVLTGLLPTTTGIYNNGQWWKPALPEIETLPECFGRAGYHVAGGGKLFHHTPGFNPPRQWKEYFHQVFDDPWHRPKAGEILPVRGLAWPEGFPLCGLENVRCGTRPPVNPREFDWGAFEKPDLAMGDGQMVTWAKEQLQRDHDKPFFLAAGIFRPHLPWYAPQPYFDLYPLDELRLPDVPTDDLDDVPAAGRAMANYRGDEWQYLKQQGRWREAVQAYLASISFADAMVGRLLDALDRSAYAHNTIVILWSDHGWHLGEKHHWHKFTLWEESTRVPLVVVAPGVTTVGSHSTESVGLIDIYPTLVELCQIPHSNQLDGLSLAPLLHDPAATRERPVLVSHGRGNYAIRDENYRYIRYADGSEELYDHRVDSHEWNNLADRQEQNDVKARLSKWLPQEAAQGAPRKNSYKFDPQRYRWKRK
jgi:arylsulfatase A-like enzyme